MLDNFQKPKLSTAMFVVASLATIIILGVLDILWKINLKTQVSYGSTDKYYFNTKAAASDPFITRNPNLKDMLAGPIISKSDPSMGYEDSPVTIVEYSDFVCSFCGEEEQVLKKLMQKYKNQVRLIWKDYPESDPESLSFQAAVAARCAGDQNNFWPYHDFLFESIANGQFDNLTPESRIEGFLRLAELLKLNKKDFTKCLASDKIKKLIYDNIEEANALEINGVPFVYINDQEVMGNFSFEEIERIFNLELKPN